MLEITSYLHVELHNTYIFKLLNNEIDNFFLLSLINFNVTNHNTLKIQLFYIINSSKNYMLSHLVNILIYFDNNIK